MFPSFNVNVTGLDKDTYYCIAVEMVLSSAHRYKYCTDPEEFKNANGKGWKVAGPADYQTYLGSKIYLHPNSPARGSQWMEQHISFAKLKLTNNQLDPKNNVSSISPKGTKTNQNLKTQTNRLFSAPQIILNSMHKYVPRIWVICCNGSMCCNNPGLYPRPSKCFTFQETEFIAVTAYQVKKWTVQYYFN